MELDDPRERRIRPSVIHMSTSEKSLLAAILSPSTVRVPRAVRVSMGTHRAKGQKLPQQEAARKNKIVIIMEKPKPTPWIPSHKRLSDRELWLQIYYMGGGGRN